ncbi:MAG: hypothetical protein DRN18_03785 [Thermoplasmata archaeon]|nr:MAG: hypothetical protein DRN18_03785 [Thermoplasmata archaeon]
MKTINNPTRVRINAKEKKNRKSLSWNRVRGASAEICKTQPINLILSTECPERTSKYATTKKRADTKLATLEDI